jgi:hypothetical protein
MRRFSVCLGVILSWHVVCVPPTYACDWRATLLDTTSNDIKDFEIDDTPLTIPLLQPDHGVHVICVLQKEDVEKSADEVSKVDIKCLYPDKQILHARAVTGVNFATKRIMTLPAHLAFSSTTQADKAAYALTVDCQ